MILVEFILVICFVSLMFYAVAKLFQYGMLCFVAILTFPFYLFKGNLSAWITMLTHRKGIDVRSGNYHRSMADEVEEGSMSAYYRQKLDPLNKDNYFRR